MAKKENTNTHPYPPEKDFTSADKEVLLGQSIYYLCLINSCLQEEHWRDSMVLNWSTYYYENRIIS